MSRLGLPELSLSPSTRCWKTIGIEGDRSCPELRELSHCRNCPIYAAAGRDMLNQPLPSGYQESWAVALGMPKESVTVSELRSVAIFRLRDEWFGLSAAAFQAVTTIVPIRRIPQRSNDVLLGLVNISGELQLCISLADLLGLPQMSGASGKNSSDTTIQQLTYARMVVIQLGAARWVFPVDDIYGIERFGIDAIKTAPTNVSQLADRLTQGVIEWRGQFVSYLDDQRLSHSLQRRAIT
jgi:chemotaxis-related protein WspD